MDDQCLSHNSPQRSAAQASVDVQKQGRPNVIRCGWLRKQGGFVKTWHSRWFVLRGDHLYYYKDEEETKALGCSGISWKGLSFREPRTTEGRSGDILKEEVGHFGKDS